MTQKNPNRGGSAGRVDATRGGKHRRLEHAGEKRKHARFVAIAPNSWQVLIRDVWLHLVTTLEES
jgi:hypothetical protein